MHTTQLSQEQIEFCPLFRAQQCVSNLSELVFALEQMNWSSWQTTAGFAKELQNAQATLSCIKDET